MAEANSINSDLLFLYLTIIPMFLAYLFSKMFVFLGGIDRQAAHVSDRVRLHKGFRPKHQYRYHWFKARMKRKKKKRFRKPKPLFHLTYRGRLLIVCISLWLRAQRSINKATMQLHRLRSRLILWKHSWYSWWYFRRVRPIDLNYAYTSSPIAFAGHQDNVSTINRARFDTDSFAIGIDSQCSRTMSGDKSHFRNLCPVQPGQFNPVDGIGGGLAIHSIGDFVFRLTADDGSVHTIVLPNSLYVPGMKLPLLCPQHWCSVAGDHKPVRDGTGSTTVDGYTKLFWNQRRFSKRVLHSPRTNTPIFWSTAGTVSYTAFEAIMSRNQENLRLFSSRTNPRLPPPEEFIAEEWLHRSKRDTGSEGANADDATVTTSNVDHQSCSDPAGPCPLHPTANHKWGECSQHRPHLQQSIESLTFNPVPTEEEEMILKATTAEAELMRWHHRLGHLPFSALKILAQRGDIPKSLANVKPMTCAGCMFGGLTKQPTRNKGEKRTIFKATKPGECVSVDQMESPNQVGFVAQSKGILTTARYRYATIFVDHYSRFKYIHFQQTLTGTETLEAKRRFERFAKDVGVRIDHYHCDNGRFADKLFRTACAESNQQLTFCGVNAHFQNGIAEKAIRDITEAGRKSLLHAKLRWPAAIDLALWPYAMRSALHAHNNVAIIDGKSRLELFAGTSVGANLKHYHVFGCPVFALDNALASGNSIPRWSPRARLGINLGPSPDHARNVNLVLNPSTGLVSPQFHCKYDDFFETTRFNQAEATTNAAWRTKAHLRSNSNNIGNQNDAASLLRESAIGSPNAATDDSTGTTVNSVSTTANRQSSSSPTTDPSEAPTVNPSSSQTRENEGASGAPSAGVSSRGRRRSLSRRMAESVAQRDFFGEGDMHYMTAFANAPVHDPASFHDWHLDLQDRMRQPIAFHAEMMGDIMYFNQAMRQHDSVEFVKAVVKEVDGHVKAKRWRVIKRSEIPEGNEPIPSVWSMRRKRNLTTNEVTKHKARLNLHGGKQQFGVNYFETYAPVVTWFAIRIMIVFAVLFDWALRQIDFVQAYPQAPIETDMYMELPQGIETRHGNSKDHVLHLQSNLYGQKQAGRVWNGYMVEKLVDCGFQPSLVDECVFYKGDVIFIVYVDDGIFVSKDDSKVTEIIQQLRKSGLDIEDQGHPADYVGVNIKRSRDGVYDFTQRALIDTIIEDCNISGVYTKPVPAKSSQVLHAFENSPDFAGDFSYRSAVGKLNYLAQTTRPDIMYAVHQVAKYSSCPKREHGEAIIYICRYLMRTRDIGLKFKPDPTKGFENYCDADFSGNWMAQFAQFDPSTSKSRSGWITFYAACPIIWASKLQTQVALSTTEAEYIALSQSLRDVIPIMQLLEEMKSRGFEVICTNPHVFCKTFEDNSGALELARLPKLRPRTKHINVCYHHFREAVRKGDVKIFPISTDDQIADALTKPLAQNTFCRHRRFMCGQ